MVPKIQKKDIAWRTKGAVNKANSQKMPNHVHMFITGNPTLAPNEIVGSIKGYTSKVLREQYPELKKMPTLWTRSYFVSTAGKVSQFVIQKYIEEQYKK